MRNLPSCVFLLSVVALQSGSLNLRAEEPAPAKPSPEHKFLERFVGDWECESEAYFEPGKPPLVCKGTMTGRMIGGFWATVDVRVEEGAFPFQGQGLFGFDASKTKTYYGTWADSMMPFLWRYTDGKVEGNRLILLSEGPDPSKPGGMMKTRDVWDFKSADQLVLTGEMEGPDGKWITIMKSTCRLKKSAKRQ